LSNKAGCSLSHGPVTGPIWHPATLIWLETGRFQDRGRRLMEPDHPFVDPRFSRSELQGSLSVEGDIQ
jgi:hypothetical protein